MRKFKNGDRVKLLDKSCGQILGLDRMLKPHLVGKIPNPSSGIVTNYDEDHFSFGRMYTVLVDDYDELTHRFRMYSFKEHDLMKEDEWGISGELFELSEELFII
jgi:hypothetical protein